MAGTKYKAFLSYVHKDNQSEGSKVTHWFHERLTDKVRLLTGEEPIEIFLDEDAIKWGQEWRGRIEDALSEVLLFIPIVTPSYFNHEECRRELQEFLEHQRKVGRKLVLPIYYLACAQLENEEAKAEDELAQALAKLEWVDWRKVRAMGKNTITVEKELERLAHELLAAYQRVSQDVEEQPSVEKEHVEAPPEARAAAKSAARSRRKTRPSRRRKRGEHGATSTQIAERVVVDPEGAVRTIKDALAGVAPGGEVVVQPGTYRETLVIDKILRLSGDGPAEKIVLEGLEEPVLVLDTTMGVVANLTLRQAGHGGNPAVRAPRGGPE